MNILILGGSGFVGTHLIPELLQKHKLVCWARSEASALKIKSISEKVITISSFTDLPTKPDLIINLIADYGRSGNEISEIHSANCQVPFEIIKSVEANVLNLSTPLPAQYSPYASAKRQLEQELNQLPNLKVIHLRLHNVYGKRAPISNFIAEIISALQSSRELELTAGSQKRDFIHIDDVLRGIVTVVENFSSIREAVLELGTGQAVAIKTLVEFLKTELKSNSKIIYGARPTNPFEANELAAQTKILNSLGWKCQYDWQTGIKSLIPSDN